MYNNQGKVIVATSKELGEISVVFAEALVRWHTDWCYVMLCTGALATRDLHGSLALTHFTLHKENISTLWLESSKV